MCVFVRVCEWAQPLPTRDATGLTGRSARQNRFEPVRPLWVRFSDAFHLAQQDAAAMEQESARERESAAIGVGIAGGGGGGGGGVGMHVQV